jgi:hypothetical protein
MMKRLDNLVVFIIISSIFWGKNVCANTDNKENNIAKLPDNSVYEGQFKNFKKGNIEGEGTLIFFNGDKWVGGFLDFQPHGKGKYHSDGRIEDVEFDNGHFIENEQIYQYR